MNSSRPWKWALGAQLASLIYFETCVLVPLGAWNDQPGGNAPFSKDNIVLGAIVGGVQLLILAGTYWRFKPLLWFGLAAYSLWLILHFQGLWVPYIFGASPGYATMYARVFGRTTKLLPNFGNHLAPDAMHIFIDVFAAAVLVTMVNYMRSQRRSQASAPAASSNES
ncbi:MAG TPA: hypothetical protein VMH00_01745 [Candidatus Limnocylindrales bacterium]|nr:hypothetical protein [Candidatus Limnocylindrales bacterium]